MVESYLSKVTQSIELTVQSWYASKSELLTECLKSTLKPTENFQEVISNEVPYQKFTNLQNSAFSRECF